MRKIISLLILTGIYSVSVAQSRTTYVEYLKIKRDAIINEIPFPEKTISAAIEDTLRKLGYKGKESKGFIIYKGVNVPALGNVAYDLYFSVERKSKKEKEISNVTMMMAKDFDNFVSDSSDATALSKGKTYLDSLRTIVAIYDLEQQINEQAELVKKNEKIMKGLIDDGEDYAKKKKKIEEQIEDNIKEKEKQESEIKIQNQVLETLKGKRRS
jgi:hypothetical protein